MPHEALYIPESVEDRGKWLKTHPVVYRWTNGAGWVNPTSYEVVKMKAVNHEPVIRLEGTLAFYSRSKLLPDFYN